MKEVYRRAASIVVLRQSAVCAPEGCLDAYQVLLLRKPRKNDAWQLPQGGMEGEENVEQAALRELQEEAGIEIATILGESAEVYQYDFPGSFRRFRPDNVRGQLIRFIIATVPPETAVTVDQQEIDSYAWIDPEQLQLYIKRKEYLQLVRRVVEEAVALAIKSP